MASLIPLTGGSPAELDLGSTYGVMLLSTIIVAVLYGFSLLQTLFYYERFSSKDPWILKASVAALWVLDTLTMAFNCHAVYYYLIANYGNPSVLEQETWSAQAELVVTYTIVLIVQMFFIQRMYQLRPHLWYIPAFLAALAVASFVMILAIFADVVHHPNWVDTGGPRVTTLLKVNWLLGMVVDVSITVILCWYFWSEKAEVRHKTNLLLNRMIIFMVHRGAVAAQIQVLTLVTKLLFPDTLVWLAFHNALSKVYTNSMLAILNARVSLQKILTDTELDSTKPGPPTSHRPYGLQSPASARPRRRSRAITNSLGEVETMQFAPTTTFELDLESSMQTSTNSTSSKGGGAASYPAIQLVDLPYQKPYDSVGSQGSLANASRTLTNSASSHGYETF